jgi:ribosomal protein S14|uniref:ribosomal protein S14 n=1 Tax=Cryptomonas pyrenoidifera TaxID=233184 RepID=UPI00226CC0F4|nr:ribosomal protein S14 [Cryptomonas pyrenoidifera]UZP15133.1 ribosomal protein S14 [Cryptomonas pyrenoidifera]
MKLRKKLLNDKFVRGYFNKNESKIRSLKVLARLGCLNYLETLNNFSKIEELFYVNKTKNRCFITSRSGGINRKVSLSRIKLREFVNNGLIPGFKKHSW